MDKTRYRVLTLTVGCMLFLSTTAQRVVAWPCLSGCPDCQTCTSTGCEDDCESGECCDSGTCAEPNTTWTTSVGYTLDAPDALLNEISGAINTIPNVDISLESVGLSVSKQQRDCCDGDGQLQVNGEKKAEGTVSAEASANVTVWGDSVEFEFGTETWGAEIEITAELRVEGNIDVDVTSGYRWNECDEDCAFGSFSANPSVAFVAEVSAQACATFWGVSFCVDIGMEVGIHSDWSFSLTYNQSDCDDDLQGSGSLDRLYLKFTGSANGDSDSKEYDIYNPE